MWRCNKCNSVINTEGRECPACNILSEMQYADGRPAQHDPDGRLVTCPVCHSRTRTPWPLLPGRTERSCPVCLEREQRQAQRQYNDEPDLFDTLQNFRQYEQQKQQYLNNIKKQHQHHFDIQHTQYLNEQFAKHRTSSIKRAQPKNNPHSSYATPSRPTPRLDTNKINKTPPRNIGSIFPKRPRRNKLF